MGMKKQLQVSYAKELDNLDPLRSFRDRFIIEDPELIYLDGNSLGRLPGTTPEVLNQHILQQWGQRLIRGWNEGWWLDLQSRIGDKIGKLIGAQPGECIIADSTSINLYKLVMAALEFQKQKNPRRKKIITDDLNFPSDIYILQGICRILGEGVELEIIESNDGIHGPISALELALNEETALVTLSHTAFKSAYVYDMKLVTELVHQAGALILWDLSHSAGAVAVSLHDSGADLAVGCTYKYLNGGPGAPAFLYVIDHLRDLLNNPISGWVGQMRPFDFGISYEPAPGIHRFLTGTPPILAIAAIEMGVDLLLEAGMENIREKSLAQVAYLELLYDEFLEPLGFRFNSPRVEERRGSHLSLGHHEGWRIAQALIQEMKLLPDFRHPDQIRLGITPLYTTYLDIYQAVLRLQSVINERRYQKYPYNRNIVT